MSRFINLLSKSFKKKYKNKEKMKKIISFLVVPLIVGLLAVSCEKDPIPSPEPEPIVQKVTITVTTDGNGKVVTPDGGVIESVGSYELLKGEILKLTLVPNEGYAPSVASVNDKSYSPTTSKFIGPIIGTNTTVNVSFWTDYANVLKSTAWKHDSTLVKQANGTWTRTLIWGNPKEPFRIYYIFQGDEEYSYKGNFLAYKLVNGVFQIVGKDEWYLDQSKTPPVLHVGMSNQVPEGDVTIIDKLTREEMRWAKYNEIVLGTEGARTDCKVSLSPYKP